MSSLPWSWLFWGLVVVIAIRMLLSLVYSLRDRLRQLLVDHYEAAKEEHARKASIARLQAKVRKIKEQRSEAAATIPMAPPENEQSTRRAA
ncbi:MAG: hypothetical protein MUD03_07905 [Pirellula sp.]|jgi:hypothetical protein|nr:hypothetical protein [Pirellula sp.]